MARIYRKLYIYKKGLNDWDNHNGVVTNLEPGILDCEVKWALGKMPTNKASGGDGSPVGLYLILCLILGDKQLYIKGIRKATGAQVTQQYSEQRETLKT